MSDIVRNPKPAAPRHRVDVLQPSDWPWPEPGRLPVMGVPSDVMVDPVATLPDGGPSSPPIDGEEEAYRVKDSRG